MNRNLLSIICSNSKKKPYSIKANQIGVTRNSVAINPLTGYNVSTGNVMTQVANSSVSNLISNNGVTIDTNVDGIADGIVNSAGIINMSFSNGIQTFTAIATGGTMICIAPVLTGRKYYCAMRVKTNSPLVKLRVAGQSVAYEKFHTGSNTFELLSGIVTASSTGNQDIKPMDVRSSGFTPIQFKEVVCVDLTATFGAGFEKDLAWCDANIPFFTGTLSSPSWVNPLVTHGNYGYVGGDTTELTFDFGTKVASSVVECPMKIYRSVSGSILTPNNFGTDVNTQLVEDTVQANIDSLKTQDGTSRFGSTPNVSGIFQFVIELDLSPVCNQLFGGSNSALKSALKNIAIDVWASGSGSNGGVATNGVDFKRWDSSQSAWGVTTQNTTGSIAKITKTASDNTASQTFVDSNNKMYMLIHTTYSSNGTIPSSIYLDYAKITIGLNRTVDTVTPKPVMLPKYFACLVKGFSPNWDSSTATGTSTLKKVVSIYKDGSNRLDLRYSITDRKYEFVKNGSIVIMSNQTNTKNQVVNFLIQQTTTGMRLSSLKNNGTYDVVYNTDTTLIEGLSQIYPMVTQTNVDQSDGFVESFQLYDLQALGKQSGFTDYEAESILRSDNKYYQTTTSDYTGKIRSSVVESPNISKYNTQSTLQSPTSGYFIESNQTSYDYINTLNSTNCSVTTSINGNIAQQLFSFDLISIVERKYGAIPNCSTVAEKVAWLKANVNYLTCNFYGYGSNPTGNKAYLDMWSVANSRWEYKANNDTTKSNTSSSPTLITLTKGASGGYAGVVISNAIDPNGLVHYLAYTDASNGTIASTIYTDYVSLDVTVKTGNISVYVPNTELFDINAVTLHANATRSNGVITLNATAGYQESTLFVPVLPNNRYEFVVGNISSNGYVNIDGFYGSVRTQVNPLSITTSGGSGIVTTGVNTNYLKIKLGGNTSGTFAFSNISLKLKM